HQLGIEDAKIVTTSFERPNRHFEVIAVPGDDEKKKVLQAMVKKLKTPGIIYVLHYHVPGSLEQYAQEAGRGGRDGKPSRCVLLFSPDDVAIQEFFLKGTYPT